VHLAAKALVVAIEWRLDDEFPQALKQLDLVPSWS
jgi:hypothetical protein